MSSEVYYNLDQAFFSDMNIVLLIRNSSIVGKSIIVCLWLLNMSFSQNIVQNMGISMNSPAVALMQCKIFINFNINYLLLSLSALEPRILTRWDMHHYAREAYKAGIRYIGGCCGFEPYHIRAVAEELSAERGLLPAASEKHGLWGSGLEMHTKPWVRAR